ncbi:MAG: 30S ribosomal protein S2 [Mycoplasma sp.]
MVKLDPEKHVIGTKALVENIVHIGHRKNNTNPKMLKYTYKRKRQNYVIDLSKTLDCVLDAYTFLKDLAAKKPDAKILFVGTKEKAKNIISEEALRCGSLFIDERWLGGTLTNANTINRRINKWVTLERSKSTSNFEGLTKKEKMLKDKEIERLTKYFRGIRTLKGLPDVIFLVDIVKEKVALAEAKQYNIPVIALVNTNVNPDNVNFPIPANDEDERSIRLITGLMADAVIEGKGQGEELKYAYKLEAMEPVKKEGETATEGKKEWSGDKRPFVKRPFVKREFNKDYQPRENKDGQNNQDKFNNRPPRRNNTNTRSFSTAFSTAMKKNDDNKGNN